MLRRGAENGVRGGGRAHVQLGPLVRAIQPRRTRASSNDGFAIIGAGVIARVPVAAARAAGLC
eukprot:8865733-Alexandrium_andersonii.AAC.1